MTTDIVYVDSGSADGSVAAAQDSGASIVNLDLSQPFTAVRARNEGFLAAKDLKPNVRFVQFIDGDCILAQPWINQALNFMDRHSDVAVVCGRRRERYPTASIYHSILDGEWNTPIGEAATCGGDSLVRVEASQKIGGFRPSLIAGDEPELCVRLREGRWKIWRLDEEMKQHNAAMHAFSQWWMRSVRGGYAFAEVSRLHRTSPHGVWKREIARAVSWAGIFPLFIGASFDQFVCCLGRTCPSLQVFRLGIQRGATSIKNWGFATLSIPGKFAELQGKLLLAQLAPTAF